MEEYTYTIAADAAVGSGYGRRTYWISVCTESQAVDEAVSRYGAETGVLEEDVDVDLSYDCNG